MTKDQESTLNDLLAAESGLTGWEMDFIDSLDLLRDRNLTEKQAEKLAAIAQKIL